jgi:ankyrin repeat protein
MAKQSHIIGTRTLVLLLVVAILFPLLGNIWPFIPRVEIRRSVELVEIGATPLHRAIIKKEVPIEAIEKIIEANPNDVNTIDPYLGRPIDCTSDPNVTELLLKWGASPNGPDQGMVPFRGYPPLYIAAMAGKLELVQLLLRYGADPTASSPDGLTALDIARQRGHSDVVVLLESAIGNEVNERPAVNSEVSN